MLHGFLFVAAAVALGTLAAEAAMLGLVARLGRRARPASVLSGRAAPASERKTAPSPLPHALEIADAGDEHAGRDVHFRRQAAYQRTVQKLHGRGVRLDEAGHDALRAAVERQVPR